MLASSSDATIFFAIVLLWFSGLIGTTLSLASEPTVAAALFFVVALFMPPFAVLCGVYYAAKVVLSVLV